LTATRQRFNLQAMFGSASAKFHNLIRPRLLREAA